MPGTAISACFVNILSSEPYAALYVGVGIGVVWLGEALSATAWIGMGLIVMGVAAMTLPARRVSFVVKEMP